jgi:hypothetical protein
MPAWPSRVPLRALASLLVVLCATAASAATLHRKIDFESPAYGSPGRRMSDHALIENAGTWHLFYTELVSPQTPVCRIGHATSTDLTRWTEKPTVILAGAAPWMSTGTWAPHVLPRPGGGWILLFTGRNDFGSQSIGALTSTDLDTWTLASPDPVWTGPSWTKWGPTFTNSCRDPFVWFENGGYSMIYTATTTGSRPALGHARSNDLLTWTDAGPFAVDSTSGSPADLESPFLAFANGRVELFFTRYWNRVVTAPTSEGPWDVLAGTTLDPLSIAPERIEVAGTPMLSRIRPDGCEAATAYVVIDSLAVTASGYDLAPPAPLPAGWKSTGDAFTGGPAFADGPAVRGETAALPMGLRWMSSGESYTAPDVTGQTCLVPADPERVGTLRSPRFTLLGDSLWFRLMGAASIDSAHIRLLDACTGLELARHTGPGGNGLAPGAWSNAGRRGRPVEVELVDALTRRGGVIGADAIIDSTVGTFTAPAPVAINQTHPAGGENLAPGSSYTIRWTSFSTAGIDSHVVYLSYDDFATPPVRLQKRNANQFSWGWTVPNTLQFAAKIRVVAYAKNAVHDCDTSPPFTIGVTVGVPPGTGPVPAGSLALVARGSPGPAPSFAWNAPAGTRAWLRLYDVRGRLVRVLLDGAEAGGGEARYVPWDGNDGDGRRAPPGVFFAVLSGADGARRSVSVVHVRR